MSHISDDAMKESEQGDADDAVKAFDDLRRAVEKHGAQLGAEMTIIRKALEIAFEQFELSQQAETTALKLDRILEVQVASAEHLLALMDSVALRTNPEQYARIFQRIADEVSVNLGTVMESRNREFERAVGDLGDLARRDRERRERDRWLWAVGVGGFLMGILVALLVFG